MKIRISNGFLSVILCFMSLVLAGSFMASNLMKKDMVTFVWSTSEINEELMNMMELNKPIASNSKEYNAYVTVMNQIRADERMQQIDALLMPHFLEDMITGSESDIGFIRDKFVEIVKDYDQKLTPYIVSNKTASEMLSTRVMHDVQQFYNEKVRLIKTAMPTPLMMLVMLLFYLSLMPVKIGSLLLLLASSALLFYKNKETMSWGKPFGYAIGISGVITLLIMFAVQALYKALPYSYVSTLGYFSTSNYYILGAFGVSYVVLGVATYVFEKKWKQYNTIQ